MAELVDATDLKSVDLFNREGSSPSIPKFLYHFQTFLTKVFKQHIIAFRKASEMSYSGTFLAPWG